jgi:hypothetical protein
MSFNPIDNGKSQIWIAPNYMVRDGERSFPDENGGDNLWRTGLGYVAWGDIGLKNAIINCFSFDGKRMTVFRSAEGSGGETCSRDQVTMALAALKIRGDIEDLKFIVNNSNYRISKKYVHTLDSWSWMKDLVGKCYFPLHLFMMLFYAFMSGISRLNILPLSWRFPSYAQHLACWQIYTSRKWLGLRWLASKLMLMTVERQNLLCRLLCRDKTVTGWEFRTIVWRGDFQWQRWAGDANERIMMGEGLRVLSEDEKSQNHLAKDVIKYFRPNIEFED